jgi:hypothetical protein
MKIRPFHILWYGAISAFCLSCQFVYGFNNWVTLWKTLLNISKHSRSADPVFCAFSEPRVMRLRIGDYSV